MSKATDKILEVSQLSNSYAGKPLLQNVSFSLKKGDILCLLGRSGSGKTTLLRLIAGLEQGQSGTISFDGNDIYATPPHKRGFGMMFQEYALFPHKNVAENIAFGLEMKKLPAEQKRAQVKKMLDLVGLSGFGTRRIDELSGGEQQRVALARSLAPEPRLLLLDEPLGSLDRTLRDRLTMEIRQILKSIGVTAVFVTHDQVEAFSVADKIAVLQSGKLGQFDSPEQLYRYPANREIAKFLGFSNLLDGTLDNTKNIFHSRLGQFSVTSQEEQATTVPKGKGKGEAILLIRPEGARLETEKSAPEEGHHISLCGKVTAKYYLGSSYKVSVTVNEIDLTFDLALSPPPPEPGEKIKLLVTTSSLVPIPVSE
ncbi:MAG: ABC transporter ATP-binding protein [Desulfobulbaceae bacterium]|nr:ABC transporter ATP-binding protein [Desulfobulbaceae bacterium]